MTLQVIDLTPRVGSEIRTDVETLMSGSEAATIRNILEQRGVVFFRGLDIDDAQQVAIAETLGNTVASEGEGGIYKISLDKAVNQRADYLKGSLFWHFDGSLQPYPNLAALLRAIKLSETGGQTEFCNTYAAYDDLPDDEKKSLERLRVVHSAARSQFYVNPEIRGTGDVATRALQVLPPCVDAPIGAQVAAAGRNRGLCGRHVRRGEQGAAGPPA